GDDDAPGMAVLVARGDQVLYRGACGKASLELGVDLSPDHVFRIGSVTKQFTAAAVLKLAGEGRLSLDDPLDRFLPGYPGGEAITVRMLDRKSTRLNSSHVKSSYAVFCLKKKTSITDPRTWLMS